MSRKNGKFDLMLRFEDEKIVDTSTNNIDQLGNIFDDIKKKFRGSR